MATGEKRWLRRRRRRLKRTDHACNVLPVESVVRGVDLLRELTAMPEGGTGTDARAAKGQTGQNVSFDAWVGHAGSDLLRFARITTRDADSADLVQDALIAVFLRWSRLHEAGQADAYARRVILNGHVSRWRSWGRRVTVVDPAEMTGAAPNGEAVRDEVLAARQLLATLPAVHRAAVFMRFYDDLSYRQISDVLGCREATARSYVHRALLQLRQQLDESAST